MDMTEDIETAAKTEENSPAPKQKSNLLNDAAEILETMLISIFVMLLLFTYIMRPVTVDGRSMMPTLQNEDHLLMRRILYTPQQGDIVIISSYEGHVLNSAGEVVDSGSSLQENLIKRVIAVAGQTVDVRIDEGLVYVDGVALEEEYVNEATLKDGDAFVYPITIPEGYVFVMGDNRNNSTDSRSSAVGLIDTDDILGKAFFRYYSVETTETGEKKISFKTIGFLY